MQNAVMPVAPERSPAGPRLLPISLALAALITAGGVAWGKDKPPPRRDEPQKTATGCESIGEGYVKLPGSDTCVKVSGSVRSEGAAVFGR